MAGNDDVKDAVTNAGGVQLIVIAMNRHISSSLVSETFGCGQNECIGKKTIHVKTGQTSVYCML